MKENNLRAPQPDMLQSKTKGILIFLLNVNVYTELKLVIYLLILKI